MIFLRSITHDEYDEPVGADYVPRDDALRAEMYRRFRGAAEGWPIPLTSIPAARVDAWRRQIRTGANR